MNAQQDLTTVVREWLDVEFTTLPEPGDLSNRVRTEIHQTPQQRGFGPPIPSGRFQSIFSATKFVVASVILALFGGFLLAGALNTPQGDEMVPAAVSASPSTTPEILPGVDLVTEEVEPGVYRVIGDGSGRNFANAGRPTVKGDGSVWMASTLVNASDRGNIFEVGQPGGHPGGWRLLAFAMDGTLWASDRNQPQSVRSFDGAGWTRPKSASEPDPDPEWPADYVADFAVHPDGTVWQIAEANGDDARPTLRHLGPDGWSSNAIDAFAVDPSGLDCVDLAGGSQLIITSDGTMWMSVEGNLMVRSDSDEWRSARPLGPDIDHCVTSVAANRDGLLWAEVQVVEGRPRLGDGRHLARFDGQKWEIFSTGPASDFPAAPDGDHAGPWGIEAVGPDGAVWLTDDSPEPGVGRRSFPVSFDGERWDRYPELTEHWASDPLNESLRRPSVSQIAIGPNGIAWVAVMAGDERGHHSGLYAITPETVATTE